ncbi:bifunctional UDP-N-acetylglucosamine diphosphorylase/glucosamine-1-phosphate N-acetyltransferase GlmU [Thermaerobacter sp. PB12/4term]|uniref:bifunctional UDP-N-acetylglucosamine diphosphorylase/glucosamine-1-phosphate N-acetyltransferase GlmU n=1 Tax=Thermaerobacter sp. PB12/4term TaxID=2293838 RepID=UPI000E329324|nr:bifunctional UDP-N-acetylglucosamine diphosphorylase/glucosamine-1-phosphate N-acetyltransferase GlmU [Thermaerobacter sp. PB12/4term]QIA26169.1 bifunctional UDP-N-acetylglucosamine diphosphorylase/glucosamine-1-phosphate N-acetyltransferase GlmU [Thermaerobacter sp. PB12/4term]
MDHPLHAVILAAGLGKRMRSNRAKVLHPVAGRPMVEHVVRAAEGAGAGRVVVVVGHQGEQVQALLGDRVVYAWQHQPLGTGHAVLQAEAAVAGAQDVLVLYGDTPLLEADLLRQLIDAHRRSGAAATLLTAQLDDPTGYGRIVRDEAGRVVRIVEEADATPPQRAIREVNTGMACFRREPLFDSLRRLTPANAQGEYYLVDVVALLHQQGLAVHTVTAPDPRQVEGVNDREALARAEAILRDRIRKRWMAAGVTLIDPASAWIDDDVEIGRDTVIFPNTVVAAGSRIGEGCRLGPGAHITGSVLGNQVQVWYSVVEDSQLGDGCRVGPFSHLRPGCRLAPGVHIGNFAELKNAEVGPGSKVNHHSYLGDAQVGAGVNIGAGTVTVNYDGFRKHRTIIEDEAFIGCNANLVAPVRVGQGAYVAAGSTINQDVPPGALAIARERQVNKEGWAARWRQRARGRNGDGVR